MFQVSTFIVAFLVLGVVIALVPHHAHIENQFQMFEDFIIKYNKRYESPDEFRLRFENFKASLKRIAELNSNPDDTAVYGVTQFSDMSQKEFRESLGLGQVRSQNKHHTHVRPAVVSTNVEDVPDSYDWRDRGVVTRVKNQGLCGSCWAFSAIGNIEGQYAIKTGNLVEFSEQQLVSCDSKSSGCSGGWPIYGMESIINKKGLDTENDYPYEGIDDKCNYNADKAVLNIKDVESLLPLNETLMKGYLFKHGPLSACLNSVAFQDYRSGIANPKDCDPDGIDHCITIVGYGSNPSPYWLIKNSWDTWWGEKGYGRLALGNDKCGISRNVTNAILA